MAPERPHSLVILDLSEPEAQDGGTVYHWDPVNPDRELAVLWEAARCPGGLSIQSQTLSVSRYRPGTPNTGTRWSARANRLLSRGADNREAAS
jgi:hypothetical protein